MYVLFVHFFIVLFDFTNLYFLHNSIFDVHLINLILQVFLNLWLIQDGKAAVLSPQNLLSYNEGDQFLYQQRNWNNHRRPSSYEDTFKFLGTNHSDLKYNREKISVDKPYRCSFCPYRAIRKDYLQKHESRHTGQKPYICGVCLYSTAEPSNLKRHYRNFHQDIHGIRK